MFEHERTLYKFVLNYSRLLTDDIDDARFADQPVPAANHPAWVLGHLTICTDYAAQLVGLPKKCPAEWHVLFGPGSKPTPDRSAYPSKADLLQTLADGHERVAGGVAQADMAALAKPQTIIFQQHFPTVGNLLRIS